ncbi:P-loop containing nucleoside triphosphate hydrolase protein [Aspergillus ellipticus CBS 707.79]|uniref:P-loop containing nucleoside triphosphate hydrolase protein n=1 Tax=Aspergillus ellipticus CBS 707.79 TaxID=1448320 RepID=A0A319DI24_9EURO|nr:P-loop containing nucleoside triphosphate hydrolase protein [Aspergillus ellipticus CBS 707.79]
MRLNGSRPFDAESRNTDKSDQSETPSLVEDTTKDKKLANITYVLQYLRLDGDGDYSRDRTVESETKASVVEAHDHGISVAKSVLEEYRECWQESRGNTNAGEVKTTSFISDPVLHVRSSILLNALKTIIEFESPPDALLVREYGHGEVSTNLGTGRFVFPFTDLYHHRDRLLDYREEVKKYHDQSYSDACREHIDILLEYLYSQLTPNLKTVERLWSQSVPKTTFDLIWLLLKPGSDVYVHDGNQLNAYVIESFHGGVQWGSPDVWPRPYIVTVWNLNYDGQSLSRSVKDITIGVFDGEREITSLPLFPTRFYGSSDASRIQYQEKLIERGRRFVQIVRKPTYQEYSGPSRLQGIRSFTRARVVIDHTSQPWHLNEVLGQSHRFIPCEQPYEIELGSRTRVPKCPCKRCEAKEIHQHTFQRRRFDDYDNIQLSSSTTLTDHQYSLCWSHVYAFVLKDRAWDILDVATLTEPRIETNIIDMLVMKPEANKKMIKAICEIYGGSYPHTFSSDFIQGKGEGQILLLHGPPGTGKTLTAESVAEYTKRPLLSITAADLGHEPEMLEQRLLRFFRDANKWNAIVLLDEADVYLETRSVENLRRNSIVSIFLRALDYFQGILFLTTNRVGSFDEAFMSRIHVQIGYDPLDEPSRQQIWDNHFNKLARNHEENALEIRYTYQAKDYVRNSPRLRDLNWNGREIRNAFQTAVALACYQAKQEQRSIPELTDEHLNQVVTMSQNFKDYMRAVRGEEKRKAYIAQLRNDNKNASGDA